MQTANPSEITAALPQDSSAQTKTAIRLEFIVVLAAFVALSARLLMLISRYSVNIFFMDQWEFNEATLFQHHSLWEMFRWQHGPHRQGLGAIAAFLIEPYFHWNSRAESFLVGAIVILAAACALWLKSRLFGRLTIFDVCIPLILLTPLQYETLFITANLAHGPLPLLAIILSCLAWTISNSVLRLALILLLNFLAIHTGFGFFLGIITPLALATDYWLNLRHQPRGKVLFLIALLLSAASFALFFVNYRFETSVDCAPNLWQSPLIYGQFLWLMFANTLGVKGTHFFPIVVGILMLAAILSSLVVTVATFRSQAAEDRARGLIVATLCAFCLLFSANAAYGRSCLGIQVAQVSRYVIYMGCGLLGLYLFLLTLPPSVFRKCLLTALATVLLGTIPIRWQDQAVIRFVSSAKSNWRACYFQIEDIRKCNHAVGYGVYPNTDRDLKGKLDLLKQTKQNLYATQ
jgi:hypothetical protein